MKISVIISYYKNSDALILILKALSFQIYKNFEVIISEDDNNPATPDFIKLQQSFYFYTIKHLHQEEDNGFRKNQMLNKSIRASDGELLVFLDGDCIPHKQFLKAYANNVKPNILCFGRRVMLDNLTTQNLYQSKELKTLNFLALFSTKTSQLKYALLIPILFRSIRTHGIWGCNYGILKRHLLEINGFDEDYITAGVGEDVDLEWRLTGLGVKFKSIRHEALQFHLYHKENYTIDAVNLGLQQLKDKQAQQLFICKNGLNKT